MATLTPNIHSTAKAYNFLIRVSFNTSNSLIPFKSSPSSFRCTSSRRLQTNHRVLTVFAANPNTGGGKSPKEGSNVKETSNGAAQGPPLLTILAGFFVFFLVCWIIGSIVTWLISLIVNVPPTK